MDDTALVAAMVSHDPRGLEGAYRAYAPRLLAYCRTMLDEADAADAVHDTFVVASQRADQLRDADRLLPWLYAIARNGCLRRLRGRSRQVPVAELNEVSAPTTDPAGAVQAEQVRRLVWSAAEALSPGDRQVLELMVRHGLSAVDVGSVLGVSADHAHARLSRARAQFERALAALLVARTGTADCTDLAQLLTGWDGRLTALLRKRISRHIDGCAVCGERRRRELRPAALLSSYAALPFLAVPGLLWTRIWHTSTDPTQQATRELVTRTVDRFDPRTGFPEPSPIRSSRTLAVAAGVAVLVLIGAGGAVGVLTMPDRPQADTVATSPPLVGRSPSSGPASPSQPPRTTPPRVVVGPLTVQATGLVQRMGCPRYLLDVSAVASDGPLTAATLHWAAGSAAPLSGPMTVSGRSAHQQIPRLVGAQVTWWVEVVTADHRKARTSESTLDNPCP